MGKSVIQMYLIPAWIALFLTSCKSPRVIEPHTLKVGSRSKQMVETMDTETTAREYINRINAHDASGIVALCTVDHVFTDSLGSKLSGLSQLEQGWRGYFTLFPDYRVEINMMASTNDVVLICGWAAGTHALSGKAWRTPAAWRARVVNGRLAEWQVFADNKPVYEILSHNA